MNSSTWDETSSFPLRPLLVNRVLTRNPQDSEMEKPGFHEKTVRRLCNHYVKWCMYYVLCNYTDYIKSNKTHCLIGVFQSSMIVSCCWRLNSYRLKISLNSQIYIYIHIKKIKKIIINILFNFTTIKASNLESCGSFWKAASRCNSTGPLHVSPCQSYQVSPVFATDFLSCGGSSGEGSGTSVTDGISL